MVGGEGCRDDLSEIVGIGDTVRLDTEASGERHEVDLGVDQVDADQPLGRLGGGTLPPRVLLENAVARVVEDDPGDR